MRLLSMGHDAWLCNFRLTTPNVINYTFYARVRLRHANAPPCLGRTQL